MNQERFTVSLQQDLLTVLCHDDKNGKAAIQDNDAVAQGIEPVQAKERERAREYPGHQRDK